MSRIWVLSDERVGNYKQALALAQEVKRRSSCDFQTKLIAPNNIWHGILSRLPNSLIPPALFACDSSDLQPPYPELIISCGRAAAKAALALKRADNNIKLVQILNPQAYNNMFDLLILPRHDNRAYKNALLIDGGLTDVAPKLVAAKGEAFAKRYGKLKKPIIGLLIGGGNKAYRLDADCADNIIELLQAWEARGYNIIGSFSRRTPVDLRIRLLSMAAESPAIDFWNGKGDNPYFGILSYSSALVATCDSINMVSESYHCRKPTYIIELAEKHGSVHKFARFHELQISKTRIRKTTEELDFSWVPKPCDDLARAANAVAALLG